jgi:hypothetical protein
MALQIISDADGPATAGNWTVLFETYNRKVTNAAYLALKDTAEDVKRYARQEIARGGFGKKWQTGYRVSVYPESQPSLRAAIEARHNIPYAGVFESGGRVRGREFMWIPTDNIPVLPGRLSKMTPKRFIQSFGKLSGPRKGQKHKTALLFGRIPGTKKSVPMFIGIREIQQRKRFNTGGAIVRALRNFEAHLDRRIGEEITR